MSLVVTEQTTELILPSRIEAVAEAAAAAAKFLSSAGFGEEAAFGIDMAVREAVTNAVLHGNRLDETKRSRSRQRLAGRFRNYCPRPWAWFLTGGRP